MTKEKWNGRQLLVGIDIGSTTTKVVATDKAGKRFFIQTTDGTMRIRFRA